MHPFIHELIEKILWRASLAVLNVNFPLRGHVDWDHFKMVSQGLHKPTVILSKLALIQEGQDYYWLAGELDYGAESVPTDVEFARKGYITGVALTWKQQCDTDIRGFKIF